MTDVGRLRPHNEDFVACHVPRNPEDLMHKGAIYLVADGMGGHQAGEVASRQAVEVVIREYYGDEHDDISASLVRAIQMANQSIYEQSQADPTRTGMGSTLVAAVARGQKIYIANVGDSRAYVIGKNSIRQITDDHSWVAEQVRAGLLTPAQARRHPQRNLVTRALGSRPTVEVDLFEEQLGAGDVLLICSDGLTGQVQDSEIEAIVGGYPPQEAVQLLVDKANERGGNDNISVLLIVGDKGLAPAVVAGLPVLRGLPLVPILVGGLAAILLAAGLLFVLPQLTTTPAPTTFPTFGETMTPTPSNTAIPTATEPAFSTLTPTTKGSESVSPIGTPPAGWPSSTPTPTATAQGI